MSGRAQSVVMPPAVAACGGGGDGLAMLGAGLAERGAQVHQAGCEAGAAAVDLTAPGRGGRAGAVLRDDAVAHQQLARRVEARRRVEQADIGDQQVGHGRVIDCMASPRQGEAPAMSRAPLPRAHPGEASPCSRPISAASPPNCLISWEPAGSARSPPDIPASRLRTATPWWRGCARLREARGERVVGRKIGLLQYGGWDGHEHRRPSGTSIVHTSVRGLTTSPFPPRPPGAADRARDRAAPGARP